ncbi:MAG TPA: bifunctional [glutamate--ammonia ligase]-adenylyl-L-tyrosine phosphorylase/[glutamate--ammonia-ligase] adenylyltransferase [Legionella sp.]|nr:bifunctional [glutamate--ammonia ligase]-adenylyl-L-tyrosine phosphorylase/[glutamate--ammonia-ligase] adenylyltransferase [Legionella sp.]
MLILSIEFHDYLPAKRTLFLTQFATCVHPLMASVALLLQGSDYAARHVTALHLLLDQDDCQNVLAIDAYQVLVLNIPLDLPLTAFKSALRQFRHRHLLRLVLRELAGLATTGDTLAAWSDCADAIILHALTFCEEQLFARFGHPRHATGERAQCYVLAMGKLGGQELNFSSDIDLIVAFSEAGFTDGETSISNQEFYTKVVQQFMQLLQTVTTEGFVFRVDLRLRPNGESGPLVCSVLAMETYYQEQGRDWERYAMVKARVIGDGCAWFYRLITPFVYRRYIDFSVIESLRSMKAMITREIQLNPMLDDIKRGQGGIREVEFIIQSVQLIWGGRLVRLQQQNALLALQAVYDARLLPAETGALSAAYLFLRQLENALQIHNDQQTHALPNDEVKRVQIMLMMGIDTWSDVITRLHHYQGVIHDAFVAILGPVESDEERTRQLNHQLSSVWQGHVEATMAEHWLAGLGFPDAHRCYQMIHAFRHSPRCRHLIHSVRMRLDRFMILLLSELTQVESADFVLLQVLHLLEKIVGRSAYLALLTENKQALQALLYCFAHSPFITSLVLEQPFLLEVLLDEAPSWRPPSRVQLDHLLRERLSSSDDREVLDEVFRQFKLTHWLLAARAELYGFCDAVRVGRFLSDVAEVILVHVVRCACQQMRDRLPLTSQMHSHFAIVAYGTLGSRDMNYDSDLDLVFLHTADLQDVHWVTRLTQKILHMLTTRSQTGVLYSVDTRLRPSGEAGLLVSHVDAFVNYQRTEAWVWEHQALLRARMLCAPKALKRAFHQLKSDVLCLPRDRAWLRREVLTMREKMNTSSERESIKQVAGGLLDLAFLVQYLVLAHPQKSFVRATHTLVQLNQLFLYHVLSKTQARTLKKAYRNNQQMLHQQVLRGAAPVTRRGHENDVLAISQGFYNA